MSEIVAVLVVPAPGDPGGLLAAGACSSLPPAGVWLGGPDEPECGGWYRLGTPPEWWSEGVGWDWTDPAPTALPLWWDGALVPEGWDRARRVWWAGSGEDQLHRIAQFWDEPRRREVLALAGYLVRAGLAARVVRLARVDGRLVEVAP